MARLIALEWDADEARVLLATSRGSGLTLEKAFSVPLPHRNIKGETDQSAAGEALRAALQQRSVGKADCVVAVGRASIELKYLSLPPAPDDELPDLVRFQAMREFNTLGDDWPLDFLPLDRDADQPRNVLAAAIAPQLVEQIRATCHGAGIEPQRLILRPCAVASLLRRHRPEAGEQVRLLVDLLASEVDLTVMRGDSVVFLRTARIAAESHSPEAAKPLILEIRRTLAAVSQRLGDQRVEAIYVCGDGEAHRASAKQIEKELELPVHLFDPFGTVQLGYDFRANPPEHPGRFAPLVGMLVDEAQGGTHEIDFLHPRQKPVPPNRRNTFAIAGVGAAAFAALLIFWMWLKVNSLDEEIAELSTRSKALDVEVTRAGETRKKVEAINKWAESDIVWLDELHDLAIKLPEAQEVRLTSLNVRAQASAGTIDLQGLVNAVPTVDVLEQKLLDGRHSVEGKSVGYDGKSAGYPYAFKSTVVINPDVPRKPPAEEVRTPVEKSDKQNSRPAGEGSK